MNSARTLLLVVGLALLVALGWWFFPSNARLVRTRFQTLATLVSVPAGEQDLARLARARKFGTMVTSDVEVTFDLPSRSPASGDPAEAGEGAAPLTGRDTLVLLVARPPGVPGDIKADLADVAVQVASGGTQASSTARARLTLTDPQTNKPSVEEHDVSLDWRKVDGEWLVAIARVGAALSSPAIEHR
jgi:hypothetical protein